MFIFFDYSNLEIVNFNEKYFLASSSKADGLKLYDIIEEDYLSLGIANHFKKILKCFDCKNYLQIDNSQQLILMDYTENTSKKISSKNDKISAFFFNNIDNVLIVGYKNKDVDLFN